MARRNGRKVKRERLPRIEVIYEHQSGICYLCAKGVPHPRTEWVHHLERASLDHVTPKHPENPEHACRRIRRNALVAHHGCNNKKANRMPHPCELLFLDAVNLRIEKQALVVRN